MELDLTAHVTSHRACGTTPKVHTVQKQTLVLSCATQLPLVGECVKSKDLMMSILAVLREGKRMRSPLLQCALQ